MNFSSQIYEGYTNVSECVHLCTSWYRYIWFSHAKINNGIINNYENYEECISDCCLTQTQQIFSYIMEKTN